MKIYIFLFAALADFVVAIWLFTMAITRDFDSAEQAAFMMAWSIHSYVSMAASKQRQAKIKCGK